MDDSNSNTTVEIAGRAVDDTTTVSKIHLIMINPQM